MQPIIAIYVLWLLWFLCWLAASLGAGRSARRIKLWQEVVFRTIAVVGTLLLFSFTPWPGLDVQYQLWRPLNATGGWLLVLLTFLGFAFAGWARGQLGWTNDLTHMEELRVVETGPYRIVRQPIFLGVIVAALASAMVFGKPSAIAGAAILIVAFLFKMLMEEHLLRNELDAYDDYAERVPMLVPFLTFGAEHSVSAAPLPPKAEAKTEPDLRQPATAMPVVAATEPQVSVPLPEPTSEPAESVQAVEEKPGPEPEPSPAVLPPIVTTPVSVAFIQLTLPLAAPDVEEPAAESSEPDEPAEEPSQPALSEAMSMTKR